MMIDKIKDIAKCAGDILLKYYKTDFKVETKENKSDNYVTIADKESEEFIKRRLNEEFPSIQILSEETLQKDIDFSKDVFLVDPMDSTSSFVEKRDSFSVVIGLAKNGVPLLGVVYIPVTKEFYYAKKGEGAYYEKEGVSIKIHVTSQDSLKDSNLLISHSYEKRLNKEIIDGLDTKTKKRSPGIALKMALITKGVGDVYVSQGVRAAKWDLCAPHAILEEAGGKVTYYDGSPIDYKQEDPKLITPFICSNTILHEALIDAIKKIKIEKKQKD